MFTGGRISSLWLKQKPRTQLQAILCTVVTYCYRIWNFVENVGNLGLGTRLLHSVCLDPLTFWPYLGIHVHFVHDVYLGVGTRLLKSIGRSFLDVLPCFIDRHSYMHVNIMIVCSNHTRYGQHINFFFFLIVKFAVSACLRPLQKQY